MGRRPPRGWIAARAFPIDFEIVPESPDEHGSRGSVIDTSHPFKATWEVRVVGREPVRFGDERRGPAWIAPSSISGKRWYQPRLKRSHGLMKSVGVPGFVDPADSTQLWIDWDAAYEEHAQAWDREGRVARAASEREGAFENITHRVFNPFDGKLRPGEESLVDERLARRHGESRPAAPDEQTDLANRVAYAQWLRGKGRKASAVVVSHEDTGRKVAHIAVVLITLDVEDGGETRRVTYEHIWGPAHASMYRTGTTVTVRVDPEDPHRIELP